MAKENVEIKDVLKEKEYLKLLVSTIINRFGDSLDAVAFSWMVYQITNSGTWSALIFGLNILPNVIFMPFTGAIVERLDKRKVIIITHFLRGILLLSFIMIYLLGYVNGWVMAVYTVLITTIEAFNMPAGTAIIPKVLKKEYLTRGMSLNTTITGLFTLLGTGIAGVIIAKAGLFTVMIIDAATFFIAALIIMMIHIEKNGKTDLEEGKKESYFELLAGGIRYIRKDRAMVNYFIIAILLNPFLVPINSLQAPLVSECYNMGSELLSIIGIAGSIGSIIGSALIPYISRKMSMRKILIIFGLIMSLGVLLVPFGGMISDNNIIKAIFIVICFVAMTMTSCIIVGMINIQFVTHIEESYLARSISVFSSLSTATIPAISVLVGWANLNFKTGTIISFCGVIAILFFIVLIFVNPNLEMGAKIKNEVKLT